MNMPSLIGKQEYCFGGQGHQNQFFPRKSVCGRSAELDKRQLTTRLWEELFEIMAAKANEQR